MARNGSDSRYHMELLDRWRSGDRAAGNVLFHQFFRAVYEFFRRRVPPNEVDDLVQETFVACVKGRDAFRHQSSFRTYLFKIATYTLYGYWRRRGNRPASAELDEELVESLSTSIGTRIVRQEDRARLLEALRKLSPDEQLIIGLHYWEGLERDELAEVFEVEEATTRSRLFRARQALREHLEELDGGRIPESNDGNGLDGWARSICSPEGSDAEEGVRSAPPPERSRRG